MDIHGEPIFPSPHEFDIMFDKLCNVTKSLRERYQIIYNISSDVVDEFIKFIVVADKYYYVEQMCSNGAYKVVTYHNKWVDAFKERGYPLMVRNLVFDPLAYLHIIRDIKKQFLDLDDNACEYSLMILPWNKFIMSDYDDDIIHPRHYTGENVCDCHMNPNFHCGIIESTIIPGQLAQIDTRMKSIDISPTLYTWYDAVRYHGDSMNSSSLCDDESIMRMMMMKQDGGLRLSHITVDMLASSDTAWSYIGDIVDDFMRCVFVRNDDSDILPNVELSTGLYNLFFTHLTLVQNPGFFYSL